MNPYDLFNAVSELKIAVGVEDEAEFISEVNKHFSKNYRWSHNNLIVVVLKQIVALEKRNEDHVQRRGKKTFPAGSEDGGPPLKPDVDD